METIKCVKCGCIMGAASEVCPMCGTAVAPKVSTQSDTLNKSVVFNGLIEALEENVTLQMKNPQVVVETEVDCSQFDNDDDIYMSQIHFPIRNFSIKDCDKRLVDTHNDGQVHLIMQFHLSEGTDEFEKFKALESFTMFVDEKSGMEHTFTTDCGKEIEKAAIIFTSVLMSVYGAEYDLHNKYHNNTGTKKKEISKKASKCEGDIFYPMYWWEL